MDAAGRFASPQREKKLRWNVQPPWRVYPIDRCDRVASRGRYKTERTDERCAAPQKPNDR
jgi:hypothetical protein